MVDRTSPGSYQSPRRSLRNPGDMFYSSMQRDSHSGRSMVMPFPSYWLIGGCLLLAPLAAIVETYRQEVPAQTPRSAYQLALERAVAAGTPGVQAVVNVGGVEWHGVAGLASREQRTRMTADH